MTSTAKTLAPGDTLADTAAAPASRPVEGGATYQQYASPRRWLMLAVLFLVATCAYLDRHIVAVLLEPIKKEFAVSDTQLGLLTGFAFALFYAALGIPVARWADTGNRKLVVSVALLVWSVFTVLCGMATSFVQLALARVGVGAGEAGAIPPSQSLLIDYFPPERRGLALSVFMSSATLGYLIAFAGGAYLAQAYGWRTALLAVGLPGLLLVVLSHLVLDEPRSRNKLPTGAAQGGPPKGVFAALMELWHKPSYVWLLGAAAAYGLVAYGAAVFIPSFMVRSLKVNLAEVGAVYGAISAVQSLVATLAGGWLTDKLGGRDKRWYAWLPGICCAASFPLQLWALTATSYTSYLILGSAAGFVLALGFMSMFNALHAVCGSGRRSLAVAVFMFIMSLIGSGCGPLITGAISDALAATQGAESLRYAMMVANCLLVPTAVFCFLSGRAIPRDLED